MSWKTTTIPFWQILPGAPTVVQPEWDVVKSHQDYDNEWTERFHIWELRGRESDADRLDGELLNTVDRTEPSTEALLAQVNPFRQPQYILLNLALGGQVGLYSKDYYQLDTSSTTCVYPRRTAP